MKVNLESLFCFLLFTAPLNWIHIMRKICLVVCNHGTMWCITSIHRVWINFIPITLVSRKSTCPQKSAHPLLLAVLHTPSYQGSSLLFHWLS